VAVSLKKELKKGATIPYKPKKVVMIARIYSSALMENRALEIDTSILDKTILGTLIFQGSDINIMPFSTVEIL